MKKTLPPYSLVNQLGISLLEIVISMMVVGFVALVIANVPQASRLIVSSNRGVLAKEIVSKKLESLRNLGYASLSNGTTQISVVEDSRLNKLPGVSSVVIVSDCPNQMCASSERTKKVEVKVSWSESGKIKNVDVITFISEGGLH